MQIAKPVRIEDLPILAQSEARSRPWYEKRGSFLSGDNYLPVKRTMDVVLGVLVLPVLVPVLLLCCVAIRIDSRGPVFFSQLRTGRGGHRFRMWKLRTMHKNAEELKIKFAHLNELEPPDFKIRNDPRITRVGKLLRKTSLDELPQILNVLRGNMSIIGPRPTSFEAKTYDRWHLARLDTQPGVTGLWQVSGRNDLQFDERVRLDIAYARNRSLELDLKILYRTFGAVSQMRGAN